MKPLGQIVNICVDVLTEEVEDGGKKLKESLSQVPPSGTVRSLVYAAQL